MTVSPKAGFSLIEALVALTIVALALIPLMALQGDVARQQVRQKEARESLSRQASALAVLRDINPATAGSGEIRLDNQSVLRWTSRLVAAPVRTLLQEGGEGDFEVALYRLDVVIGRADGGQPSRFEVDQVGWRKLSAASAPMRPPAVR